MRGEMRFQGIGYKVLRRDSGLIPVMGGDERVGGEQAATAWRHHVGGGEIGGVFRGQARMIEAALAGGGAWLQHGVARACALRRLGGGGCRGQSECEADQCC